jgi:hypothetical protein
LNLVYQLRMFLKVLYSPASVQGVVLEDCHLFPQGEQEEAVPLEVELVEELSYLLAEAVVQDFPFQVEVEVQDYLFHEEEGVVQVKDYPFPEQAEEVQDFHSHFSFQEEGVEVEVEVQGFPFQEEEAGVEM